MDRAQITVAVTEEDIARATRNDPTACPIALALGRLFDRPVNVGITTASVIYPHGVGVYRLPKKARRFIAAFDAGRPVEPTTFRVTYMREER